jgi:DNA-binding CsgD family transcriptional regulator
MPDEDQSQEASSAPHLAPRELEILTLVAQGMTDNEIAMQLYMSAKTVSWYMGEIRSKLDASSRAHAVALAIQQSILCGKLSQEEDP